MNKSKKVLSAALSVLMAFTPVSGLANLTACQQEQTTFTVTFRTGTGASAVNAQTVKVGTRADEPQTPTREGYVFAGWYTDAMFTGTQFDFGTIISKDITLHAKWIEEDLAIKYEVTLVWGEGLPAETIEVVEGTAISVKDFPTVDGKLFVGWYTADGTDGNWGKSYDEKNAIFDDKIIYARWAGEEDVCKVTFTTEHGKAPAVQNVLIGGKAKYPIEKPSDDGTIFTGWFDEYGDPYDFNTIVETNITLVAGHREITSNEVVTVRFGGYTVDGTQQAAYNQMCNEFNETYGKYRGIYIQNSIVGTWQEYNTRANASMGSKGGFDVYMINDRNFKAWAQSRGGEMLNLGAITDSKGNALTSNPLFDQQLDNMWSGMIDRFRLNKDGWTSYEDDQLWVVPIDSNPTALYYNRTVLEKNGIIVISIEDIMITADNYETLCAKYETLAEIPLEDAERQTLLDLWNQDLIADLFGNKYSELKFVTGDSLTDAYGGEISYSYLADGGYTIPAKGFYRSEYPRNFAGGHKYTAPADGEVLVFNASIAMSWDESEDIAMICTKSINSNSVSTYGYYTQWWFCYGWTVGGDCCEDTTGEGTWAFSLSDYTANYMVTENACTQNNPNDANGRNKYYIGEYTGKLYSAGDTLEFLDKLDVSKIQFTQNGSVTTVSGGDIILPNDDGSWTKMSYDGTSSETIGKSAGALGDELTDNSAIRATIRNNSSQDQNSGEWFVELPSTKEAFTRFCRLVPSDVDQNHVSVSYPTSSATADETADITKLGNGTVAFVIERGDKLGHLRNVAREYRQEWGVANVPIFKEYGADGETVKRQGVPAGHSECVALGISKAANADNDDVIDEAWEFIQWMAADYFYIDPADGSVYFGKQKKTTDMRYRAGQAVKADKGYIPNQPSLFEKPDEEGGANKTTFIKEGEENLNLQLFAYAIEYESPGDWWYLPTNAWITQWASSLNASDGVRGGKVTSAGWFESGIIKNTNVKLAEGFNYYNNAENLKQAWRQKLGANII